MSKKAKYHFDIHSLSFKKATTSIKDRLKRFATVMGISLVFSAAMFVGFLLFFESPKEKFLRREVENYKIQFNILNKRADKMAVVMKDLQHRDDDIYRLIFEAEPISEATRNAGIGGVERYAQLRGFESSDLVIATSKEIDQLSRQMYVQSKSFDQIFKLAKSKKEFMAHIPAIMPISKKEGSIHSGFGMRFHPILKYMRPHSGIDIVASFGTVIHAPGDGVVEKVEEMSGYGLCIIINHGFGYQTLYGHLSKALVNPGQKIKRGESIAKVGSTGLSQAPHLHYEVIQNGNKVNPIRFFFNDLTPDEYQQVIEKAKEENQCLS